jgi:hypothetical protein
VVPPRVLPSVNDSSGALQQFVLAIACLICTVRVPRREAAHGCVSVSSA